MLPKLGGIEVTVVAVAVMLFNHLLLLPVRQEGGEGAKRKPVSVKTRRLRAMR